MSWARTGLRGLLWLPVALAGLTPHALAAEVTALRVVPTLLAADGVSLDPEAALAVQRSFSQTVRAAWPDAVAQGEAREDGPVRDGGAPIVHVGLKISRWSVDTFAISTKTARVLRATLTPFALDLGTGEILASRSFSWIATAETMGEPQDGLNALLLDALLSDGVPTAVRRFGEVFEPNRTWTTVVDVGQGEAWIGAGSQDGVYAGERFRTQVGDIVDVVATEPHVSRIQAADGATLAVGTRLFHEGAPAASANAPRVLVQRTAASPVGTDSDTVAMWAEDALATAGWNVVPYGSKLLEAQLREASVVDLTQERLVNFQSPPDLVAVPTVWRADSVVDVGSDQSAVVEAHAGVRIDLYDAKTGLLVRSLVGEHTQAFSTVESAAFRFAEIMRISALKDGFASLGADAINRPVLAASVPVAQWQAEGVTWPIADLALPFGAVGEVRHVLRPFVDPNSGESLDGPTEIIGVARVVANEGSDVRASWVFNTQPVHKGDTFVSKSGGGAGPVRISGLVVRLQDADQPTLSEAARTGVLSAQGVQFVADAQAQGQLQDVATLVNAGGYAQGYDFEPFAALWAVDLQFTVRVAERAKGSLVERVVRVDATAQVSDASSGVEVLLKAPSSDVALSSYTMWTEHVYSTHLRHDARALALTDDAVSGQVADAARQTGAELGRRLAVMLRLVGR
jgi:hypothetical protein